MDRDRALVRLAKHGNRRAFTKLVHRYRDKILALTFDFLQDYDVAKDVAQEVFIKAYRNLSDFEERSKFSSWLFRIAINTSLDTRKMIVRRKESSLENTPDGQIEDESLSVNEGLDDVLADALGHLSEKQKSAIVLRYFQQMSIREIADVLDCADSTVRIHLHRALQNLNKFLTKN